MTFEELLEEKIMTVVSDFVNAQSAFNNQISASVASIEAEISSLKAQVLQLSTSTNLSAEDQASLDALKVSGQAIVDKLTAITAPAQG